MFTENTIAGLQNLAAQAAREMAQAGRISELQRSVRDQEALINRFRDQISELQRRSESAAVIGWSNYIEGRGQAGFGFDYEGGSIVSANDLPDHIRQSVQHGDVVLERRGTEQLVNVPITLRDQVLGALTFAIPADRGINERQVDMLRTVANRLAVALESNRLLEQTQAQAQRERKANEIGSVLLSETNMEAVASLAAENFNEALGAIHTRVYLEPGVFTGDVNVPAQERP
jgi:GAF domain-containing protein